MLEPVLWHRQEGKNAGFAQMPEIGQILFGQPREAHNMPEWARSMFQGVLREWKRVWWNVYQFEWEYRDDDIGAIHFRHYRFNVNDNDDPGPNFWVDSDPMKLRWYKHPGRGMTCSHAYTPEQWIAWHDAVMKELRRIDGDNELKHAIRRRHT